MKPLFEKKGRFTESKGGYKIDQRIIIAWAVLMIGTVIAGGLWIYKNGNFYLACPEDGRECQNPYYQQCGFLEKHLSECQYYKYDYLCEQQFLPDGFQIGKPNPFFLSDITVIFSGSLMFFMLLNHHLHNKNYFKGKEGFK